MAEEDRVAARVTMRGIHLGEFQGLAPIGKRVEDKAIDMFHVSGGNIVEHWNTATIRLTSRPRLVFLAFRERQLSEIHHPA